MSRDLHPRPEGTHYNLLATHMSVPDEKAFWRVVVDRDPSRESLVRLAEDLQEKHYMDYRHFAIEIVEVKREVLNL